MTNIVEGMEVFTPSGARGVVAVAEDGYYVVDLDNGSEQDFTDATKLRTVDEYNAAEDLKMKNFQSKTRMEPSSILAVGKSYQPEQGDMTRAVKAIRVFNSVVPDIIEHVTHQEDQSLNALERIMAFSEITKIPVGSLLVVGEWNDQGLARMALTKSMLMTESNMVGSLILGRANEVIKAHESI